MFSPIYDGTYPHSGLFFAMYYPTTVDEPTGILRNIRSAGRFRARKTRAGDTKNGWSAPYTRFHRNSKIREAESYGGSP